MGTLTVRLDPESEAILKRLTSKGGKTKSEVVRQALLSLHKGESRKTGRLRPFDLLEDVIGCWDSGGLGLSQRTGERFAKLLKERAARRDAH
jgi:Arc/MetJ-type ribon-helix-helix transcriptional regulator